MEHYNDKAMALLFHRWPAQPPLKYTLVYLPIVSLPRDQPVVFCSGCPVEGIRVSDIGTFWTFLWIGCISTFPGGLRPQLHQPHRAVGMGPA